MSTGQRIVVAMSGGVDSAVAAGILARAGYDVVGVTLRLWTLEDGDAPRSQRRCCSVEDTDDARRAADIIGVPHYVMNMEQAFRERVVDYFVDEYARGRTPNPCIACNEHIKFRALLDRADAFGAAALATGHYARIEHSAGRWRLLRAVDPQKDQSYVLYTLGQAELGRTRFPLGAMPKSRVRELAREMRLELADKPDSADICFVPEGDHRRFLRERLDLAPGVIEDERGVAVGSHDGAAGFTVGQRRGVGIATGERRFVTGVDVVRNVITVGPEEALMRRSATVERVSWTAGTAPDHPVRAGVKVRYRTAPAPALVMPSDDGTARVDFDSPQRAITPGQAAVFYAQDEVLGGGVIAP